MYTLRNPPLFTLVFQSGTKRNISIKCYFKSTGNTPILYIVVKLSTKMRMNVIIHFSFWVVLTALFIMLVLFICPRSERLQTWQKCAADREWNPWSLPQIPGDIPQPANPARTWGAPQDLWWGLVVFFKVERIPKCGYTAFANSLSGCCTTVRSPMFSLYSAFTWPDSNGFSNYS